MYIYEALIRPSPLSDILSQFLFVMITKYLNEKVNFSFSSLIAYLLFCSVTGDKN